MSSIVDGVLLVVHGGRSSREQVLRSRKALQEVGARIFGVILNNVTVRSNDYYYHHYYQESYRANGNGNGNGDGNGHGNGNSNGASANGNHAVSRRKDNSLHLS
jgi:receptor protein-tyrosine kinase